MEPFPPQGGPVPDRVLTLIGLHRCTPTPECTDARHPNQPNVLEKARIEGAQNFVSLNATLESNREEEVWGRTC